jgi:hypothetical protein
MGTRSLQLSNQSAHLKGRVLDRVRVVPGATPADDLGLVEADDHLGQRIVVRIANAAEREFDAGLRQSLALLFLLHAPKCIQTAFILESHIR